MKKLMIRCIALLATILFARCGRENYEGTYVASVKSQYSVAEDTIVIKKDIIINRVGYRRILNGELKSKEFSQKVWKINSSEAPIIQPGKHQIAIGSTIYKQIK